MILAARDTAFSTTPGKVGLETPSLAGGHAALVIGIQVISPLPPSPECERKPIQ